jgi:hypothetical protein
VDEEGSFIDAGTVARTTGVGGSAAGGGAAAAASIWRWFWAGKSAAVPAAPAVSVDSGACAYHGAERLVVSDDRDPAAGSDGEECQCKDAEGRPVAGGKNLLMISGPDGFIEHYVGAKVWAGGKELQGPVKGVVGELKRKYPSLGEDWLVLKM